MDIQGIHITPLVVGPPNGAALSVPSLHLYHQKSEDRGLTNGRSGQAAHDMDEMMPTWKGARSESTGSAIPRRSSHHGETEDMERVKNSKPHGLYPNFDLHYVYRYSNPPPRSPPPQPTVNNHSFRRSTYSRCVTLPECNNCQLYGGPWLHSPRKWFRK